jgi:hypothetical protein
VGAVAAVWSDAVRVGAGQCESVRSVQYVAVRSCSAVQCSVLRYFAVSRDALQCLAVPRGVLRCVVVQRGTKLVLLG